MKVVLLTGGGIDSTALLLYVKDIYPAAEIFLLHVDYGQKAVEGELRSVQYFAKKYNAHVQTLTVTLYDIAESAILKGTEVGKEQIENRLEGRNIIFMALAATYACKIDAETIFLGFHREPANKPFPDATLYAMVDMQRVFNTAYGKRITIEAPFKTWTRYDILKESAGADVEILTKSYTCYEAGFKECGICVHCKTKKEMLLQLEAEKGIKVCAE